MVARAQKRHDALDVGAHVVFGEGSARDEAEHHDARLAVDKLGGEPCPERGLARGALPVAKDVMHGDIAAAASDVFAGAIPDEEGGVADAALQRFEFHRRAPARKLLDATFEGDSGHSGSFGRF